MPSNSTDEAENKNLLLFKIRPETLITPLDQLHSSLQRFNHINPHAEMQELTQYTSEIFGTRMKILTNIVPTSL